MTVEDRAATEDIEGAHSAGQRTRPLRIAMVAPPWFELPPRGYGGIESVVADLVDQLVLRGHQVTLVGSGSNGTAASAFLPVFDPAPSGRLGSVGPEIIHAAASAHLLEDLEVDVVHDHSLAGPLLARGRRTPTVMTMHGPVDGEHGDYARWLGDSVQVVAISDAQRRRDPAVNWSGRVHNAVAVDTFPFRAEKRNYLLWLGRFSPDKGPHLAIDTARAAGIPLVLAGKQCEPAEQAFFDAEIRPRLGPGVEFVGEADAHLKRELLADARALVFPLQWEEPFGMVMIEAMACGTPVVALRRGSAPEVVVHGRTGLLVDRLEVFPAALRAAETIDPAACRAHVRERFDLPVMAAGYEQIYGAAIEASRAFEVGARGHLSLATGRRRGRVRG